uniref:Endonuclease/exonuclease/phosphatase domain-containing protein n=1 Tax=Amphiprion percula TaxID=161767 RepID=A0A3P8S110_AMPPE
YTSVLTMCRGVAILIHKRLPFTLDKIVQDKEGRFVIITGFLHGEQILIGSVCAPNSYESSFYSRLLAEISAVCPPHVVLGGDFNCGLAPDLDYKPAKNFPLSKISHATAELCSDLGLLDAWRVINPQEKDFTFFSHPHHSFSRIDYIFVSRLTLDQIKTCSINTCILSDHSSVTVELMPPHYDPQARLWRMNPLLLSNPSFMSYLEAEWKLYISKNDTPDTSASTLWEAGKAFMRGSIISYTAARRKIALSKQLDLEQQIQSLDRELKTSLSTIVLKKLAAARSALDHLLTQKAESAIFFAKHRLFTSGNKPGRLLARLARGQTGPTTISSLKDSTGAQHVKTKSICNIMKEFYQKLYTAEKGNFSNKPIRHLKKQQTLKSKTFGNQIRH